MYAIKCGKNKTEASTLYLGLGLGQADLISSFCIGIKLLYYLRILYRKSFFFLLKSIAFHFWPIHCILQMETVTSSPKNMEHYAHFHFALVGIRGQKVCIPVIKC